MYIGSVKKMIKAVLFDLDGTLVNSLADLAASANYALSVMGYPTHETEKYKYFVGDGMPKLIERVLPESERTAEIHKKCLDIFMAHYSEHYVDKTYVYDGIKDLLDTLKKKGLKLAVISNKSQEPAVTVVNKLFGGGVFDIVCGKQEGYPAKPDPALTLKVINDLGVNTNESVLIGDSGMDAAAAVNAGCVGIGVLWGFRTEKELRDNGDKYIVDTPKKILEVLEELQ